MGKYIFSFMLAFVFFKNGMTVFLKRQCHEIFLDFKGTNLEPYTQAKIALLNSLYSH